MITLEGDALVFRIPEVHEDATCSINFQRTLRIPDDGKDYPLPPGLESFPLRHLDDYGRRIPENRLARGGVVMPMHQAEAMWLSFGGRGWGGGYPFAAKVTTGMDAAPEGGRGAHPDEWARPVPGQHLHRTAVALAEVRVHLSACLLRRARRPPGDRQLDDLLQPPPSACRAWRRDAGQGM